jgi:hypothetical protein
MILKLLSSIFSKKTSDEERLGKISETESYIANSSPRTSSIDGLPKRSIYDSDNTKEKLPSITRQLKSQTIDLSEHGVSISVNATSTTYGSIAPTSEEVQQCFQPLSGFIALGDTASKKKTPSARIGSIFNSVFKRMTASFLSILNNQIKIGLVYSSIKNLRTLS